MATTASNAQYIPPPVEFQSAITALQDSVSKEDVRAFTITSYKDVWATARKIERDLERRKSLRNFRRLQPFLLGLEQYSKAIDVLCNGTPILPYIWVSVSSNLDSGLSNGVQGPIKLLLEVSNW